MCNGRDGYQRNLRLSSNNLLLRHDYFYIQNETWYVSLEWDFIYLLLFLALVHGFMHETSDFLIYNNLFIYQVLYTLIYRRRSLYSFLLYGSVFAQQPLTESLLHICSFCTPHAPLVLSWLVLEVDVPLHFLSPTSDFCDISFTSMETSINASR